MSRNIITISLMMSCACIGPHNHGLQVCTYCVSAYRRCGKKKQCESSVVYGCVCVYVCVCMDVFCLFVYVFMFECVWVCRCVRECRRV